MTTIALPLSSSAPAAKPPENSDGALTKRIVFLGTVIDICGIFRQINAMVHAGASLAGTVATIAVSGTCASIALLITGILSLMLALTDAIPEAHTLLSDAQEDLEKAQEQPDSALKPGQVHEAQKALTIRKLGMANQYLFLTMALGQIATAITSIPVTTLEALGVSKAVQATSAAASVVANCVLSAIYFLRGIVAIRRANKNLDLIKEFEQGFHEAKALGVESAIDFIKGCEHKFGPDYLARRLDTDASCLGDKKASKCGSLEEKMEFLKLVEKALFSQKLKHEIARGIGYAMVIGAILAIIAMQLAATPAALHIVEGASAAFFLAVEIPFLINDNPTIFVKWRDWRYAQAEKKLTGPVITQEDEDLDEAWMNSVGKYREVAAFMHKSLVPSVHPRNLHY